MRGIDWNLVCKAGVGWNFEGSGDLYGVLIGPRKLSTMDFVICTHKEREGGSRCNGLVNTKE